MLVTVDGIITAVNMLHPILAGDSALLPMYVTSLEKVMMQGFEVHREQQPDAPFVVQTTVPC